MSRPRHLPESDSHLESSSYVDSDPRVAPVKLHARAMDNLAYIRETMESSGQFTTLSGLGSILLGVVGLAAAPIASSQPTAERWLVTWLLAAALAVPLGGSAVVRKTRRAEVSLLSGHGRRFVLGFVPAMAAGALVTVALFREGLVHLMPGCWLLMYGTGVLTAGMFSVRIIPLMGFSFMLVGTGALFAPPEWGDSFMAAGFGVIHLSYGIIIARRYGG